MVSVQALVEIVVVAVVRALGKVIGRTAAGSIYTCPRCYSALGLRIAAQRGTDTLDANTDILACAVVQL